MAGRGSAAAGDGTTVLVFYRGIWCPYCNVALSAYQQHLLPALTERGVRLAAVSPQAPDGSLSMQEKHHLGFAVLSDPGNRIARTLGILTQPSEHSARSPPTCSPAPRTSAQSTSSRSSRRTNRAGKELLVAAPS